MEILLEHLRSQWGLVAKPGSKKILPTKGADTSSLVGSDWKVEEVSEVLGHCIQNDGGISHGWANMVSKMWGAFYANVRAPSWRRLGTQRRLTLVDRCIEGLVSFYVSIMPPQHSYCCDLIKIQKKMVAGAMGNFKLVVEDWETFRRRSAKESVKWIEEHGEWWSRKWMAQAISWNNHLCRDYDRQLQHWSDGFPSDSMGTCWS